MSKPTITSTLEAIRSQLDSIAAGQHDVALSKLLAVKKILSAAPGKAGRKKGSQGLIRRQDIAVLVWEKMSLDKKPLDEIIHEAIGTGLLDKAKTDRAHKKRLERAKKKLADK